MKSMSIGLLVVVLACSSGSGTAVDAWSGDSGKDAVPNDGGDPGPDQAFVHKVDSPQMVKASEKYLMDEPVQYIVPAAPAVRSLAWASGTLWAGSTGLYRYDPADDGFSAVSLGSVADHETVQDIAEDALVDGRIVVVQLDRVILLDPPTGQVWISSEAGSWFTSAAAGAEEAWIGTSESGLWRVDLDSSEGELNVDQVPGTEGVVGILDVALDKDGVVWMATDDGLYSWDHKTLRKLTAAEGFLPDDEVRAVVRVDGGVAAGTAFGMAFVGGSGSAIVSAGIGGLPAGDLWSLAFHDGLYAMGHWKGGASSLTWVPQASKPIGNVNHYISRRWLPLDSVSDVVFDGDGRLWIGTTGGVTRIDWVEHTLAEKAAYHEKLLDDHFWRMGGFVSSGAWIDDPWDPTKWSVTDHDNDGLWTQMQVAAWCYAYAATGDEAYYQKARKAMDVMFLQIDIPAVDFEAAGLGRGFVTRSLVRDDEGDIYEDKKARPNWHLVHYTDGHDYYWKDDTSSDETDGHFFGYPLFYDLCAKDDAERAGVADHAGALAGYILENGFLLIDLDGKKTGYGHWNPERLACAVDGMQPCVEKFMAAGEPEKAIEWCGGSWFGEGWLNSLEILGHLLAAWHMTGDAKFFDAYDDLIGVHGYDRLAMPHDETATIVDPAFMNHSDHELAMLAYQTLIRYEPDEARRAKWIESLMFLYDYEKVEHNPLWAAFVALAAGSGRADMEAALESLREMPFDRREWRVDNSHRKDAIPWPNDRFGDPQWDRVFPYDEIRTVWWNGNFHAMVDGGDGRSVSGPMAWLLPYWALRYSGVVGE